VKYSSKNIAELKTKIVDTISNQGFSVNGMVSPIVNNKTDLRRIHYKARKEQLEKHRKFLKENISLVRKNSISGEYLNPERINLELIEIKKNTKEEKLYKWWNLVWWSMPYQRAYGRQMRFLIWDKYHNCPFGLIGLQSPVLRMAVRDKYLEIPKEELDLWVNRSMQAQRVGALPPYNDLIGGKMVALTLATNEIRQAYKNKYRERLTLLENRRIDSDLLFITTSSAFGRSSIYNRLRIENETIAQKLGNTKGFGTFHIPDALFKEIKTFLEYKGVNTETTFGFGPSKRIKLLYQVFQLLNLPNYSRHRILREYYLFPHVANLKEVIGQRSDPIFYDRQFHNLMDYWKTRWCIARSKRTDQWKKFNSIDLTQEIAEL